MARSENQKQKLFRILEMLITETDEQHGLSVKDIISRLEAFGINAERKSIYDDILTIGELGFDVITLPKKPPEYTLATRPFELAELKMLVDAVESSRFITAKKSREVIEKLRALAGKRHSAELSRQVYVEDRVKTENDFSFDNIDLIHRAINENQRISFKYFYYTGKGERIFRHDGKVYLVCPIALLINDGNYYLVAYDSEAGGDKHFRVDKMTAITLTGEPRCREVTGGRFNPAEYSKKIFGMYGGKEELVTLDFKERLAGVVIDRFGSDITLRESDFGFRASMRVMLSPNFYGWVMGFGNEVRIVAPSYVREELLHRISDISALYESEADK